MGNIDFKMSDASPVGMKTKAAGPATKSAVHLNNDQSSFPSQSIVAPVADSAFGGVAGPAWGSGNELQASIYTLAFGNVHVGQSAAATIGITNDFAQPTDVVAGVVQNGGGFVYSNTPAYLAGLGSGSIGVTFDPHAAGQYGTTLTLVQYTADSLATIVGNQSVQIDATAFAYADPILSATTLDLGAARVGGVLAGDLLIANGAAANAYQESLAFTIAGAAGLAVTNGAGTVAAGGTADIGVSLNTAATGALSIVTPLYLVSTGVGTSGLADTYLGAPGIVVTGAVYQQAIAQVSATTIELGNVHVGAAAVGELGITNVATGALTDTLLASVTGTGAGVYAAGALDLAAGHYGSVAVQFAPLGAGAYSGLLTVALTSHDAALADLSLGDQSVAVTGAAFAYAAPILSATTLDLGTARVGGVLAGALTIADGTAASAYQESLLYSVAAAPGIATTDGSGTILAGGSATLGFALGTAAAGAQSLSTTLALTSTGAGTSFLADTGLAGQTISVSGTVYQTAVAQLGASSVAFGNFHVGDTAVASLGVTNSASGALTDALLAAASESGAGFSAGTGLSLDAGQSGTIALALSTAAAGAFGGMLNLALSSHDSVLADLSLGTSGIGLSGAVFAYAAPILSATTLALGTVRVGGVLSSAVTVADGVAASAYQESLAYSLAAAGGLAAANGVGTVVAGGTATLGLTLATAVSGLETVSTTLALTSTGAGTSGLADTSLAGQTISVSGTVYQQAIAQIGTSTLNFGIVHVGSSAQGSVSVTNGASGALVDQLLGSIGAVTSGFTASGSVALAAGQGGSFGVGLNTAAAGVYSGTLTLGFSSHDSALMDLALGNGVVALSGTVDNYATAVIGAAGGQGIFSGSGAAYTLSFGSVTLGTVAAETLSVTNAVQGPADLLSGAISALAGGSGFSNSGLGSFSGLAAGQAFGGIGVTLAATLSGTYSETLQLTPTGSNASGYSGALATQNVIVSATVIGSYALTGAPQTITAGNGTDYFYAAANTLGAGDSINGSGGTNILVLTGTGIHNLGAPAALTNIQTVNATEQVGGQIDTLRHNMNGVTVNVASVAGGSITIYGASNNDIINLGNGNDTVVIGSGAETVYGGAGTDTYLISTSVAAGAIHAGSGTNLLTFTGGGTFVMGANFSGTFQTVTLSGASGTAYKFTASTQQTLAIVAATGSATIIVNNASQTVTGANAVVDVQATAALAGVKVSNVAAGSLLEITAAGTATMNAADTVLTVKLDKAVTLSMNQTGFLTAIGAVAGDTIKAAAANQTLTSLAGSDTLVGYSGYGDMFSGTTAGMNLDGIGNFGGSDKIDITDFAFGATTTETFKAVGANTMVTLANGTQSMSFTLGGSFKASSLVFGSDGHTGTLIGIPGH